MFLFIRRLFLFLFQLAVFVLWCYGSKFLLTIFITPLVFAASLSTLCQQIVSRLSDDDLSRCGLIYPAPDTSHSWGGWTDYPFALSSAQQTAALLLVVHYSEYNYHYHHIHIQGLGHLPVLTSIFQLSFYCLPTHLWLVGL